MGVYDRQIKQAQRLMKKGQSVLWEKHTVATDVAQPWKAHAGATAPTFPVRIVFLPPLKRSEFDTHLMEGSTVPEGRPRGLMGAVTGFVPAIDDTIIRGSERYTIACMDILAPNGEVILYKINFS